MIDAYFFGLELSVGRKVYSCNYLDEYDLHTYIIYRKNYGSIEVLRVLEEKVVIIVKQRYATKEDIDYGYRYCESHKFYKGSFYFTFSVDSVKEAIKNYDEYFTRIADQRGV